MAPFGKRFPSRYAIIAACYQDEFATNSTCRIDASASRFYSVVVDDARNITFDGDTSLRRGFLGQKSGRRASWGVLGATAKECRHSSHINLPSVLMRQHHRVRAPTINTVDCYQNIQWGPAAKKYSVKKGRLRL